MIEQDRADALGVLYAWDSTGSDSVDTEGVSTRAAHLAMGVVSNAEGIDQAITDAATSWRIERMAVVDRNILRLGTFELQHTGLSRAIVIDEAIRLAKEFSTAGSGKFINGVLEKIATNVRDAEEPAS
ncbi:MAG: transcription antitermination factor NusB [Actinomycetota bacterium]|jgi:transcription antitermination factor NusB|nr:transcription antitermination factor NusB [Actinomycetota bacterium]